MRMPSLKHIAEYLSHPSNISGYSGFKRILVRMRRLMSYFVYRIVSKQFVTATFHSLGFSLVLPVGYGVVTSLYVLRDDYEPELKLIEPYLTDGIVFVDVGANFGFYSVYASKKVGARGIVLAVEPNPFVSNILRKNTLINSCENVIIETCALSERAGFATFWIHDQDPWGSSSLVKTSKTPQSNIIVPVRTLDDLVDTYKINRVHVIKIDVEGSELEVIKGARRVFDSSRPVVLMEWSSERQKQAGHKWNELEDILREFKYEMFIADANGLQPVSRSLETQSGKYSVIALPLKD